MSPTPSRQIKQIAGLTAASLGAFTSPHAQAAIPLADFTGPIQREDLAQTTFAFAHEGVLGTSLELHVECSTDAEAIHCQQAIFQEIERLRQILSTYDPASEISRLRLGAKVASPELAELLSLYGHWTERTDGAVSAYLGGAIQLWKDAAQAGRLPTAKELQTANRSISALNVDALGKGYIIDRAVAVARKIAPSGLLNIGGDIRAWGNSAWLVGVADPLQPAENAPLLAQFPLRNAAVASSGGYARYFSIGGKKYSHVIDPRTFAPVAPLSSATIVAVNAVTANALATAGCVLHVAQAESLAMTESLGHLIMDASGKLFRGGIFAATDSPSPSTPPPAATPAASTAAPAGSDGKTPAAQPAADAPWPKDYQVTVNLALGVGSSSLPPAGTAPGAGVRRANNGGKRPFVAIWIEDAKLNTVRSLVMLGTNPKYQRELTNWFKATGGNNTLLRAIARATRPAGQYQFVWDGKDDSGKPLPAGKYTLFVEINREHGTHAQIYANIVCGADAATYPLRATAESDASTVVYGPKDQPAAPAPPAADGKVAATPPPAVN
jgi:thiamine biosynthesis lipoprotein ApbE